MAAMMAMAASASANDAAAAATATKPRNHPTYKEMIVGAIQALKDGTGSSRKAIAKHIVANYKDLPPTHNSLLSLHLRRLKKKGVLLMLKHSYKLNPEGGRLAMVQNPPPGIPKKRGRPPKNSTSGADIAQGIEKKRWPKKMLTQEGIGPQIVKRKPGRPRLKPLSVERLVLPKSMKSMLKVSTRKRGRPRKGFEVERKKPGRPKKGSSPALSTGEKRKPGRPKKGISPALSLGEKRKPGWPKIRSSAVLLSAEKRKPGRPKMGSSPALSLGEKKKRGLPKMGSSPALLLGEKRKPVRPKIGSSPRLSLGAKRKQGRPWVGSSLSMPSGDKRKPGRPKRGSSPAISSGEKRKRGRPKKESLAIVPMLDSSLPSVDKKKLGQPKKGSSDVNHTGAKRKPGRPKKESEPTKPKLATGSASGENRKRGRPKKDSAAAMGGNGGNVSVVTLAQYTEGEVPPEPLAVNIVGAVPAVAEDRNNSGILSFSWLEKPAEGSTVGETSQVVAISSEKKKRGRPPKIKRDGDGAPNLVPSDSTK